MPHFQLVPEMLDRAILEQIRREVQEAAEPEIKRAVEEYEKKVREQVGRVVIRMATQFSVERQGTQLFIKAEISGSK